MTASEVPAPPDRVGLRVMDFADVELALWRVRVVGIELQKIGELANAQVKLTPFWSLTAVPNRSGAAEAERCIGLLPCGAAGGGVTVFCITP